MEPLNLLDSMDDEMAWQEKHGGGPKESVYHVAVRSLRLNHLKMLLENGCLDDPGVLDKYGKTVLHVLMMRLQTHWNTSSSVGRPLDPHPRIVLQLVVALLARVGSATATEHILLPDKLGFTSLDYALSLGNLGIFAVLFEHIAADAEPKRALLTKMCLAAIAYNKHDLVTYLGGKVAACKYPRSLCVLLVAAVEGQRDQALKALLGIPAFLAAINEAEAGGLGPLEAALIGYGHYRGSSGGGGSSAGSDSSISSSGSSSSSSGRSSSSSSDGGSRHQSVALQTIRYLLMKGASAIHTLSNSSRSVLGVQANSDNYFALAALHGQVDVVRILLESAGNPVVAPYLYLAKVEKGAESSNNSSNSSNNSSSSSSGELKGLGLGLGLGSSGEQFAFAFHCGHCSFASNPLVSCIRSGHAACLDYLLVHTNFKALVNHPDAQDGLTPLACAAQAGDVAMVTLLLRHGADPAFRIDTGLSQPAYASNEAAMRASAGRIDLALEQARDTGSSRRGLANALTTLRAQVLSLQKKSAEIKDALGMISMACKYSILQLGGTVPSIKAFVVSILGALKSAKLLVRTKKLNMATDWAKVLFGSPSFFKAMATLTDQMLAGVTDKMYRPSSLSPNPSSPSMVPYDHILQGVQAALAIEQASRSRWSVEINSERGRTLVRLLLDWCIWTQEACQQMLQEEAAENVILAQDSAPLLALHALYRDYTACLDGFLRVPRFTLACNYSLRALPKYSGFKAATSNAAAIWGELSSKAYAQGVAAWTPAIHYIAPSLRDHRRDWWWDVAEASDWTLLAGLIPTIFRYESDVEALLSRAIAVQPPPSWLVLEFAAQGLVAGKVEALLYDSVQRVDCDAFLVLLLTGLFDDDTANLWAKLRATLEWHMHHGEFSALHSRLGDIGLEQRRVTKQGPGIADLRSPAAPHSLDERATVIAGVIEASKAHSKQLERLAQAAAQRPPAVETPTMLGRKSLLRNVIQGVLFCGMSLDLAEQAVYQASETVRGRIQASARRVWCCLSPYHRLGSVVSVESLASQEGSADAHACAILGLHGEVLPLLCAKWAFIRRVSCHPKNENIFDRNIIMGRFLCMPRLPSGILLHAHGGLVAALACNNNPAMARCLLRALQSRGMCCANAPLPFCQSESLCTLATKAASGAALKVYLKSLTTCPRFRGGLQDKCGMGNAPNPTAMTRPVPGEDNLDIDIIKLVASLDAAAQKRLLQARRRLESMYYVLGRGASACNAEPLEAVLALVRNASALIDLSVPVKDLLSLNRENLPGSEAQGMQLVVKICGLHDEASLQQFILRLRTRPLTTCCEAILGLERDESTKDCAWGPKLPHVSSALGPGSDAGSGSDSSFLLWRRFCASFGALAGASGHQLCDRIVCLQDLSLLNANAELQVCVDICMHVLYMITLPCYKCYLCIAINAHICA